MPCNRRVLASTVLSAASLGAVFLSTIATAGPRYATVGHRDTIERIAHRYHVPVRAIAEANGITPETTLQDGRRLVIPDAPRPAARPATMHRAAVVRGDRITVRVGPDESHRRLTLVDSGTRLVATRRAGDWLQVELPGGGTGWIRGDFLALGGAVAPRVAAARPHRVRTERAAGIARNHETAASRTASAHRAVEHAHRLAAARAHQKRLAALRATERANHARLAAAQRARHARMLVAAREREESRRAAREHAHRMIAEETDDDTSTSHRRRLALPHLRTKPARIAGRPRGSHRSSGGSDVVQTAFACRGVPYVFGGTSRSGFDCSGFTGYVYNKKGVHLPRTAAEQFHAGRRVRSGELKAGDLVFFHTTRPGVSHVGIYAGNGKFVHASSRGAVRVDSLNDGYYRRRLVGARRVK